MIDIEDLKNNFINGNLENGIYTSGVNKIVKVGSNGFSINTLQNNGWTRINIYEYIDQQWIESETYEK